MVIYHQVRIHAEQEEKGVRPSKKRRVPLKECQDPGIYEELTHLKKVIVDAQIGEATVE